MTIIKKASSGFPKPLILEWERTDGVNFAIALARLTGWLLQVDWWGIDQDDPVEKLVPLRVYVGTDTNIVFDFTGKKNLQPFAEYMIHPIAVKRAKAPRGGIVTRNYGEEDLWTLPLRFRPIEREIEKAMVAIRENTEYLEKVSKRRNPEIPAKVAADFSFGLCPIFAAALSEVRQLPAVAVIAKRYSEMFGNSRTGFCHSVVMHPDGEAEDSWGKQSLQGILDRYGVVDYELDVELQTEIIGNFKSQSISRFKELYNLVVSYLEPDAESQESIQE